MPPGEPTMCQGNSPLSRPQLSSRTLGTDQKPGYRPQPSRQQEACINNNVEEASTVQLQFNCKELQTPIYTHKTISACNGQPVDVAICRDNQVITSGPLSSAIVEIVALPGDFHPEDNSTAEDFDRWIVISRDGQGSVLEGRCFGALLSGRRSFDGIRFKEGSSKTSTRQFTLAARVVKGQDIGGLRVHESFMGSVNVKDRRSEANEKSPRPKLNDEVYRLKGIAKNGPYFQRLQMESIRTVQDFLKAYNTNPERLRDILKINSDRSTCWKTMTKHALDCDLGDMQKLKKYMIAGENAVPFFNCVHDLVGAEVCGRYVAKEEFDETLKAVVDGLKERAYDKLEGIELDYVMKDGCPIKISTSINVERASMRASAAREDDPSSSAFYSPDMMAAGTWANDVFRASDYVNQPMFTPSPPYGVFNGNNHLFESSNNLLSYHPEPDYHPAGETESQAAGEGGPPQVVPRALSSSPATKGWGANALGKRKAVSGRDTDPFARRARKRSPSALPSTTLRLSIEPESDLKSGSSDSSQEIEGHIDIKTDELVATMTKATGVEDAYHEDIGSSFCRVGAAVESEKLKVGVDATTSFAPPKAPGERVLSPRSPVFAQPTQEDQGGSFGVLSGAKVYGEVGAQQPPKVLRGAQEEASGYRDPSIPGHGDEQRALRQGLWYDTGDVSGYGSEEDPEVLKRALRDAQECQRAAEAKLKKVEAELERSQRRAKDSRDDL